MITATATHETKDLPVGCRLPHLWPLLSLFVSAVDVQGVPPEAWISHEREGLAVLAPCARGESPMRCKVVLSVRRSPLELGPLWWRRIATVPHTVFTGLGLDLCVAFCGRLTCFAAVYAQVVDDGVAI